MKLDFLLSAKDSLQLFIQVDDPALFWVLKAIALDVLPKGCDNSCASLFCNSKNLLKTFTKSKSVRKMIKVEADVSCNLVNRGIFSLDVYALKCRILRILRFSPLDRHVWRLAVLFNKLNLDSFENTQ